MPRKVQICPHCGASISGNPRQCPRCDGALAATPQSIAELGPIGPETEEMISSLSATPIAPVPANPIEDEHEDDVVLWRPADASSETDKNTQDDAITESESSDSPDGTQQTDNVGQESVESLSVASSSDNDKHDHSPPVDHEATSFDILAQSQDDLESESFEPIIVETEFDTNPDIDGITTGDNVSATEETIPPEPAEELGNDSVLHVEIDDSQHTNDIVAMPPESLENDLDGDTAPQKVLMSELVEDTQDHIDVPSPEESSEIMSEEEREAFENAQTAMIPAEEAPMTPVPTLAHPRPSEPVPEPTPLPLLSSMDTEPKVVIPEAPPLPPAPFTPPPPLPQPVAQPFQPAAYPMQSPQFPQNPQFQGWQGQQPSSYWLQQRIQAYLYGGYQMREQRPNEATLAYGKSIGFFWWVLAVMSVVGLLWYLFILILSGFRKDTVYISLEPDGYIYEDGSGAAHIRRRRSRVARRWGVIGILLAIFSTFTIIIMAVSFTILMNRYDAELASAYPEFSFIQGNVNTDNLDNTQVQNVKVVIPVIIIMSTLSVIGFVGGLSMSVISYLHSAAYSVEVAPLPDLR